MDRFTNDDHNYMVVVNDEEQYSIWPEGTDPPSGWQATDQRGTKADCLAYIDVVWTDMRPKSVRKFLATGDHEDGNGDGRAHSAPP
ncbi:MbtH family protein [Microlunatus speluncae]|uniref:MbtH family protein n=1 Tax=Microlunatus speluncae TaxID=2594267 RepID=UPI0024838F80|nr:MbtH family NRPS accessory protein [Microlunatus speluncae]